MMVPCARMRTSSGCAYSAACRLVLVLALARAPVAPARIRRFRGSKRCKSVREGAGWRLKGKGTYEANRGRKLVVELMYVLVQRAPVQGAVRKVVERVLEHEKEGDLGGHEGDGREGDLVRGHAKVAADRVEQVDEGEFAGKVGEEDDFGALPDLSVGYAFLLIISMVRRPER